MLNATVSIAQYNKEMYSIHYHIIMWFFLFFAHTFKRWVLKLFTFECTLDVIDQTKSAFQYFIIYNCVVK